MSDSNDSNNNILRRHKVSKRTSRGKEYPRLSFQRSRILKDLGWEPGDELVVIEDPNSRSLTFIPESEYSEGDDE